LKRRVEIPADPRSTARTRPTTPTNDALGFSIVGAGNFASATLAPTFAADPGFRMQGLASAGGVSARSLAKKYRFVYSATDVNEVFADPRTAAVAVATRHHLHTSMGLAAMRAGKHVFLEKPLAINEEQLEEWIDGVDVLGDDCPIWTVGFNRRFSPGARLIRGAFADAVGPKQCLIRFNAGKIPADHWVHDPEVGGGRIVGEACHAIDLAVFLIGSPPVRVHAVGAAARGRPVATEDDATLVFRHADGSVSTIVYTAVGDRAAGKERIELHGDGRSAVLDDFRRVEIHADGRRVVRKSWWSQAKGYAEEAAAFRDAIRTGAPPIPYADLLAVTMASLRAVQSLRLETPLDVQ
jgi:predicted dehydrogenase